MRHTRVPTLVFKNAREVDRHVAARRRKPDPREQFGRPADGAGTCRPARRRSACTASWPACTSEEGLDFSNVVTFNLDEYWPMEKESIHSYHRFMREAFFDHVNIPPENIHIPDGTIPAARRRVVLRRLRAGHRKGRRDRPANPGHRPHGAHRLQRAGQPSRQPHADGHARPRDPAGRGQRLLRRRERSACRPSRWAWGRSSRPEKS